MKKDKNDLNEVWYNKIFCDYISRQYTSLNSINNHKRREEKLDVSGSWSTNWGALKLFQEGNVVTGSYEWDNGKIEGTIDGYNFKGFWSEPPTYECPDLKGELNLKISITGKSFDGTWSYCDLTKGGVWVGAKTAKPESTSVDGSWSVNNGILLLEEGNGKVDGTYIEGLSENPIRLYGDIVKDDNLNKFIVDGEWNKGSTYECPNDKGKIRIEFDIPINNAKIYFLDCDGNVDRTKIYEGIRIVGPEPLNISGDWNANIGNIRFVQNGGVALGSYKLGKASMEGRIIGNVFIGKWYEAGSYSCPYDSGNVQLIFSTNARVFEGYWSYCNENFNYTNVWKGVKTS
ncbi:hypothetical protein [Clostridium sp. CCUG 7971]|uniref:hypothetical protein n=1 Tax=Clostridium sp. CCUG 7971 TaxID=2811414 RepID=UPI001ABA4D6E|nr:hypothetical protein [Clostridium sp. CCUG 7971]MBO3444170.1 hypothetical protein [Clostridium sp. CCUG 7971]